MYVHPGEEPDVVYPELTRQQARCLVQALGEQSTTTVWSREDQDAVDAASAAITRELAELDARLVLIDACKAKAHGFADACAAAGIGVAASDNLVVSYDQHDQLHIHFLGTYGMFVLFLHRRDDTPLWWAAVRTTDLGAFVERVDETAPTAVELFRLLLASRRGRDIVREWGYFHASRRAFGAGVRR